MQRPFASEGNSAQLRSADNRGEIVSSLEAEMLEESWCHRLTVNCHSITLPS